MSSLQPSEFSQNLYNKFMSGFAMFPQRSESQNHLIHMDSENYNEFGSKTPKIPVPEQGKISVISENKHLTKFELSSTKIANDEEEASECIRCLWPFLRLSRLIGMCPITRRGSHLIVPRFLSPAWLVTIVAINIQSVMLANSVKTLIQNFGKGAESYVDSGNETIYYFHTLANSLYMSWRIKELPKFIVACKRIEVLCKKYQTANDGLVRDCILLFYFFASTQALGNFFYYFQVAQKSNSTTLGQFFHAFNNEFIGQWGSYYTGIFFGLGELYCDMGWTFADMLLGLLSLMLSRYFIRINRVIGKKGAPFSVDFIEELRCDHREICHLIQYCNDVFSPLFLLTYVANVGYLFTRLYTGLQQDLRHPVFSVKFESVYAFCYQIFIKMLFPSYLAARLNERAHEGLDLVHSWPSTIKGPESKYRLLVIGRFVSQFVTTQVGISGCGYFVISKSFVVTLISALITYEVIILQFQAAADSKQPAAMSNVSILAMP